ncbi:MAG: cobalamin-binding protein [Gemmatimonadota bacterium]
MSERIVSLLASGTEIVAALGLQDRLVGISHECDHPPEVLDRPRVSRPRFDPEGLSSGAVDAAVRRAMAEHGSVYAIDGERLAALRPGLILTQAVCEVCAVPTPGVRDVVRERGLDAEVVSLDAHTVDEILDSIRTVARAAGAESRAEEVVTELRRRLDTVRATVGGSVGPRVLAIEWLDPPFAPGHWVPEMIEQAGGRNLIGEAGAPSRQVAWGELEGLDPDALVVMPCGYDLDAARRDADRAADRLAAVAPRAVESGRAFVVDGSAYFNRSGPRVVDGVEILAGLLHPDRFRRPAPTAAEVWRPPGA